MAIRDANEGDVEALLALNLESERFLSPMDLARWRVLSAEAAACRVLEVDGAVAAFLLAFREGARYDSPNYRWFAGRYPRFLYVDRVVVSSGCQGMGLGSVLYRDLVAIARNSGVDLVTCEFDVEPPNEGSRRFHAKFGFREVGSQSVADGKKRVSLQVLDLESTKASPTP